MDLNLIDIAIFIVVLLFSVILHEVMHGFIADRLGDPTARLLGRLTLNPIKHIDPFLSILLPLVMLFSTNGQFVFGAAKPVPVDPFNLRDGKKDLALVSLSGPLTNIAIALFAAVLFKITGEPFLRGILHLNLVLAVFNLIPIPPLDGSKIIAMFLSDRQAAAYLSLSSFGMFIIFFLLVFPVGGFSLGDLMFNLISFAENLLGV
ncbi:MAG: site-2 protease family protein [Patescibacteria group bacterium]